MTSVPTLTSESLGTAVMGPGFRLAGSNTECVAYQLIGAQPATTYSMEVVFVVTAALLNGTLCGWNSSADGSGGTNDRTIYSEFPNWTIYHFDGAAKTATGGSCPVGTRIHLIATYDGSNLLTLYQNGVQVAQTSGVGAPYTGYANPYFCIGKAAPARDVWNGAIIQLCNFANVCWTPNEIMQRFVDPFGFLAPAPDRLIVNSVSSGVTGTGDLIAQSASVVGVGTSRSSGTGALADASATLSGAGTSRSTGTGALAAQSASASGTGASRSTGSGILTDSSAAVVGAGTSRSSGSGVLASGASTVEGGGGTPVTGTGVLSSGSATLNGTGTSRSLGSGALAADAAAATGAGSSRSTGFGVLVARASGLQGLGTSAVTGTGSLASGSARVTGSDFTLESSLTRRYVMKAPGWKYCTKTPKRAYVVKFPRAA